MSASVTPGFQTLLNIKDVDASPVLFAAFVAWVLTPLGLIILFLFIKIIKNFASGYFTQKNKQEQF